MALDFIHRAVSDSVEFVDCEGAKTVVKATHMRTSAGYACITLYVAGERVLELSSDLKDYPEAARAIADLLTRMADEPCKLPKVE